MRWKEPSFTSGYLAEFLVFATFKQDVFKIVWSFITIWRPCSIIQLTVVLIVYLISWFPKNKKNPLDFINAVASWSPEPNVS